MNSNLQHKVKVTISDSKGNKKTVLNSTKKKIPERFLTWLFGEFREVLVLKPGQTVNTIEIHEIKGEKSNE